jgi:hypothetical protein
MANLLLTRSGLTLQIHDVRAGATIRTGWTKNGEYPTHAILEHDGETVEKELETGKRNTHSAFLVIGDLEVMVNCTEGVDPSRPSWAVTVAGKKKSSEPIACSKCGDLFRPVIDLVHLAPLCSKCRLRRKSTS